MAGTRRAAEDGAPVAGPSKPPAGRRSPAWLVLVFVALVGLGYALGLLAQDMLATSIDGPVMRFAVAHRSAWANSVLDLVTNLGAPALLLVVAVGLGWAWWAFRATTVPLVMLLVAWLGAEALFNVVKLLVDRSRPPLASAVQHFGGLAFPSGHATQSAAVWGMVAALGVLGVNSRAVKLASCVAAATVAITVGITRVYLGAHWTSDVIGGWLLGCLWSLAVIWFVWPGSGADDAYLAAESSV